MKGKLDEALRILVKVLSTVITNYNCNIQVNLTIPLMSFLSFLYASFDLITLR